MATVHHRKTDGNMIGWFLWSDYIVGWREPIKEMGENKRLIINSYVFKNMYNAAAVIKRGGWPPCGIRTRRPSCGCAAD